jgi:hypothetical protein
MYTGSEVSTGPTAVFETGGIKIVVVSKHSTSPPGDGPLGMPVAS